MAFSGFGFGYGQFGHFPFGNADYGDDTVVRSFPPTYIENPTTGEVNEALKHYLFLAKKTVNDRKKEIDNIEYQVDPNTVRDDILRFLGTTLAVEVDDYEPEEFRRSLVNNSIIYYRIKGTRQSYTIRGRISGYEVEVFNIWRITPDELARTTTNFPLSTGSGSTAQDFAGTLVTFPIIKGSLKFKTNGTLFAEDDGAGNIVTVGGSGFAISLGTIDYQLGDYFFRTTPAPPANAAITVDLDSGAEDFLMAIGNGVNQNFLVNLLPYPLYPTSLSIYLNGVHIGQDNGSGAVITVTNPTYTVSGVINYRSGLCSLSVTPPPPSGELLTANFSKTLLGEFLFCHPDDIYEIPPGTDHWYVTIPPDLVAGNFTEGCGYCLTTFIKVRITVLKPVTVQPSSENFFDRLIRKLRDVTPIHIRDLLYELQLVVSIDQGQFFEVTRPQEEYQWLTHSSFHRFDMIPADVVTCDSTGVVKGTVELI
jgi:hypothetical protein